MTIADQITDLLAGFREAEFKVRHVRDEAFWGAPAGTPLPLPRGHVKPEISTPTVTPDEVDWSHRPAGPDFGAPIWAVDAGIYPPDIYGPDALHLYGDGPDSRSRDQRALDVMRFLRGNPQRRIKVYRAVPKDDTNPWREGDWVTITRVYAVEHGRSHLNGDFKIKSKTVPAYQLWTEGNSLQEWGYHPEAPDPGYERSFGYALRQARKQDPDVDREAVRAQWLEDTKKFLTPPDPGPKTKPAIGPHIPKDGQWVLGDDGESVVGFTAPRRTLVEYAMRSWVGAPADMHIHAGDAINDAPIPNGGGGKIMRAAATALLDELRENGKPVPRLYRGSTDDGALGAIPTSWSENRATAERFATLSGGVVQTLEPGSAVGLRMRDYIDSELDRYERQWLVIAPQKVRHVRDADFWGAPVGTPLPLPKDRLPVGYYWRGTDRPDEVLDAEKGTLRPSHNYLDNTEEGGVSVSDNLGTALFSGYDYIYVVAGNAIGKGSDGEPVLDPKSVRVASDLIPAKEVVKGGKIQIPELTPLDELAKKPRPELSQEEQDYLDYLDSMNNPYWEKSVAADQIKSLLAGFQAVEQKLRHVRDAEYWGLPVGTPILPGMRPQRQLPIPGVPPPPPDLPTSRSRRGGRWERDPDLLTALVGEGADPGMDVFRNYNGDLVVFEKGVVADDAVKFATIEDVDFALDHLPDEVGPVSVVFPAYDPMFQDADVSVPPDLLPPNLTLGYVMRGPLTIHLNPTMLKEMYPHIEGRSQEQGVPALSRMSLRRSVIMHESGHIMENYQGNVVASMGRERAIAANDAISRGGMSAYGMTSPQEAYAEAWAQWTLGDGSDGVYDETARGLAEVFGWPDPPNRSRAVIRPGTRKSIQDLLDTLQAKVRHVRDADYWGAPPGTPLPLPKKPKAPDPIEVLHRYQAQDIEADNDTQRRIASTLELSIRAYSGDPNYERVVIDDRQRLSEVTAHIAHNDAILAGDKPFPESTIEQVDFYIYDARVDARRRWSVDHPYDRDSQHPFQLWTADQDAFVEKDPDVVALRKAREITITHMPERFGGKPVSSQDALLYSPDEYYDVLKRVLPDEARQELPDQDAAVVFKKASQALLAERMDHEATTSLVKEVTRLRPGQIPMDLRQPGDSVDDILRRYALRQAVEQWAMSSGDSHAESIAMQRIARDEFGLDTVYMPDPEPRYCTEDDIREELDKGTDGRRAFLRAQYDLTQQVLKDQGVEALLVMRGLTLTPEQKKHLPEPGERVTAVQQPLSSWAVGDSDTAAQFGGTVVWTVVPREKVLSTPATGFGCLGENEVVVVADTLQVEVVSKR